MPRTVKEWIGATDDTKIPERVRQRVAKRANYRCQADGCGIEIRFGGEIDHTIAIINGGENRETNLRLLCALHHQEKTRKDVAEKSKTYQKRKHYGPLRRSEPKMKLSRKCDGTVCRWNPETRKHDIVIWSPRESADRERRG